MEDLQIVQLFWDRNEEAISRAEEKYGRYCASIAANILSDWSDTEECLNDCMLKAWNSIPPAKPNSLKAYLGKIIRNLALDRVESASAVKRGGGEVPLTLDELSECVSGGDDPAAEIEGKELSESINRFLRKQDALKRKLFVRRYWYMDSLNEAAQRVGLKPSNAKTILYRMRQELAEYLKSEGTEL